MKYLIVLVLVSFSLFIAVLVASPALLRIPYSYLALGVILGLIPIILEAVHCPQKFRKLLQAQAYFFYLAFVYEVTALKLGWWAFPGTEFVGWLEVFGVRFPFEELFFWIMLGSLAALSYYQFFDDEQVGRNMSKQQA